MSNVVTINGTEYKIGDIVKSKYYHKDEFNDLVLNGFTVKVGDTWLTRNKEKVKITALSGSIWPIVGGNYASTYSVLGIRNADYSISNDDLETKFVEDECAEPTQEELIPMKKKAKPAKKKKDSEDIEELPVLDIQIGDVWKTAGGKEVEIQSHMPGSTEFVWYTTCGISYTDRGTYFSTMTSTSKDLVQRISRNTEIKEALVQEPEIKEALVQEPEMPKQEEEVFSQPLGYGITNITISDASICTQDNTINFENAVKMHIDSLVSLIGDRMSEKVKNRDIAAVKYLTKVLEKVIALENL